VSFYFLKTLQKRSWRKEVVVHTMGAFVVAQVVEPFVVMVL
jgi:hypothetical protein